jgi:hypothetical protein
MPQQSGADMLCLPDGQRAGAGTNAKVVRHIWSAALNDDQEKNRLFTLTARFFLSRAIRQSSSRNGGHHHPLAQRLRHLGTNNRSKGGWAGKGTVRLPESDYRGGAFFANAVQTAQLGHIGVIDVDGSRTIFSGGQRPTARAYRA